MIAARLLRAGLAVLLVLIAGTTSAQPTTTPTQNINLTPGSCDHSMQLLNAIMSGGQGNGGAMTGIFGSANDDVLTACSTTGASWAWKASSTIGVIGKAFLYFNSIVLIFGGALLVYVVVMGTMKSAEDGEVLGKQWSTVWVPVRIACGFLALFPTASGFSAAQLFVLWLASQGVGAANYVWSNTVESFVGSQGDIVAVRLAERAGMANVMRSMLKAETCVQYMQLLVSSSTNPGGAYAVQFRPYAQGGGRLLYGNTDQAAGDPADYCGSVDVTSAAPIDFDASGTVGSAMERARPIAGLVRQAQAAIQDGQMRGISAAHEVLVPLAATMARERMRMASAQSQPAADSVSASEIVGAVTRAVVAYQGAVASSTNATLSPLMREMTSSFSRDAGQSGWITAGAWYYQLARINSQVNELSTYLPKTKEPIATDDAALGAFSADLSIKIDNAFADRDRLAQAWSATQADLGTTGVAGVLGSPMGALRNASNAVSGNVARAGYEALSVDPGNPKHAIVQLKNVGDTLIGVIETAVIGKWAAEATPLGRGLTAAGGAAVDAAKAVAGSNGGGVVGTLTSAFSRLGSGGTGLGEAGNALLFALAMSVLLGALMLAFWIPMAPFVLWIGGVFGWLVSVLEMVIAAPLWAAAHLHPEGEGMAGKYGANGYMIVLEVFLRPLLMVLGLLVAYVTVDPFLRFLSAAFFRAMGTANGGSLSGLVTIVAFVAIYVGVCIWIVQRCFALIHLVPNAVFKWIGAHANSYDAGDAAQRVQGMMALAIGKVGADKMPPRRRAAGGGGRQNEISGGGQAPKARSFDA